MSRRLLAPPLFLLVVLLLALTGKSDQRKDAPERTRLVIFLAGKDTHAWGQHKHFAGCMLLADALSKAAPDIRTKVVREWPDAAMLAKADALVMYADGFQFHPANKHLEDLTAFMDAGKGVTVLHWATGIGAAGPKNNDHNDPNYVRWRSLVGAGFEPYYSVSRIWTADFKKPASHPIMTGVRPFVLHDECYFHLHRGKGNTITRLLDVLPPAGLVAAKGETFAEGNDLARKNVAQNREKQFVAWSFDRPGGGRAFGFTGGHFHWSWARDDVRKMALNGIAWTARRDIPNGGLVSPTPSAEQMLAHVSGKNPGWTAAHLQEALRQAEQGRPVFWKRFENKPLQTISVAGNKDGDLKKGNAVGAPRLTPEQQLATFTLPKGFSIELVTSELQGTNKPVAISFDDAGRLWTMTATEYPLDTNDNKYADEARRKWREGGKDRILIIDDPLKPGPHTPRVFAEGLVMPMSVLPYKDGAIVAHGPEMISLRDTDGDGRADKRTTLLRGFGVQDSHTLAHGLMWLPDGKIFTAQGVLDNGTVTDAGGKVTSFDYGKFASFRPDGTDFQVIGAGLNNTWGIMLKRDGRMWLQEANSFDHPVAPFEEGTHYNGWRRQPYIKDPPWQPGVGSIDLGSTGLSGLAMSEDRSGGFPREWQEVMLIANAVTGTINSVELLPRANGGWSIKRNQDFLACTDPRFRPVHLSFGPDACLYVVDWYNPIISHNEVPRDHPARDKVSGRIWRVRHLSQTSRSAPNVATAPEASLIRHLQSDNTWEMRAAWHQIVEREAEDLIPELQSLATKDTDAGIHALWCLAGLGSADVSQWTPALWKDDPERAFEFVRALRSVAPSANQARTVLSALKSNPSLRVRTEIARYLQFANDVSAADLAQILTWHTEFSPKKIRAVQGETLTWEAWPQAFLNMHIRRAMELQPAAVEELASIPALIAQVPPSFRGHLQRLGYAKKFETGAFRSKDLAKPDVREAALSCAGHSDKAAALLKQYTATVQDAVSLGEEILRSPGASRSSLRKFAAPLALRLMNSEDEKTTHLGLDLAANSCSQDDSPAFIKRARAILTRDGSRVVHVVRAAIAADIRDASFYSEIATNPKLDIRANAAAWPGWFQSAPGPKQPKVEAAMRKWGASLTPADQKAALDELASTIIGTHFALNNLFPALLSQDATTLPRLFDELAERVPTHDRLGQVHDVVNKRRSVRAAEAAKRIRTLTTAANTKRIVPDRAAGKPLFAALCLNCHSAGGQGVGFAPPLDGSRNRDTAHLLAAMLEPEAAVESIFRPFRIRFFDGSLVEGFLKSRDGNRVVIQVMGGAELPCDLLRAQSARYLDGHSVMPATVAGLTDKQILDLTAYLSGL